MNELSIINSMLHVIGEDSVTSITSLHPSVVLARELLAVENEIIQGRGWFFNKETGVVLSAAADGRVIVPSTALHIKAESGNYVQREGVLYDMDNHTDIINGSVTVTLITKLAIEDLPPVAAAYLRACARYVMFENEDGEGQKMRSLTAKRDEAYRALNALDITFKSKQSEASPAVQNVMYGSSAGGL